MTEQKKKKTQVILVIVSVLVICYGAAVLSTTLARDAGPWEGRVLDIQTGEPIEEAVVLAVWYGESYGILDWVRYFHRADETLTDKNGAFKVPKYTPVNFLPVVTRIAPPRFYIYKPGYYFVDGMSSSFLTRSSNKKKEEVIGYTRGFRYSVNYKRGANIVELPKVPDLPIKEKRVFLPDPPSSVPLNTIIYFRKAENESRVKLGLSPLPIGELE